jgi:hypothetical protein
MSEDCRSKDPDFDAFVSAIRDMKLDEIIDSTTRELRMVRERRNEARSASYLNLLLGLRHLVTYGTRPSSVQHDSDLARMLPVIESLVRRGVFTPSALDVFDPTRSKV